jgi:3-oxoacyl-[acyl-carrier protein] reductase
MTQKKKLALVFGGSRGIGAACVLALAEQGFEVAYTWVHGQVVQPNGGWV